MPDQNFFERQRVARGTSIKLVVLFGVAVLAMVVAMDGIVVFLVSTRAKGDVVGLLVLSTTGTLLVIGGGMLYKTMMLRGGGAAVAASVDGTGPLVRETPRERRWAAWFRCDCR